MMKATTIGALLCTGAGTAMINHALWQGEPHAFIPATIFLLFAGVLALCSRLEDSK